MTLKYEYPMEKAWDIVELLEKWKCVPEGAAFQHTFRKQIEKYMSAAYANLESIFVNTTTPEELDKFMGLSGQVEPQDDAE